MAKGRVERQTVVERAFQENLERNSSTVLLFLLLRHYYAAAAARECLRVREIEREGERERDRKTDGQTEGQRDRERHSIAWHNARERQQIEPTAGERGGSRRTYHGIPTTGCCCMLQMEQVRRV